MLLKCLRYGHTKLDTKLLESKLRTTKIGQRNWMFIGHPEAGHMSAVLYTLLSACRSHRIYPSLYLLQELLPDTWAKNHPKAIVKEQTAV